MARMVYVETDEEITELVERIRDLKGESEIVFVLPNRSRVLQSVLNLRLLQQYSRSFMRGAAIVTSDARTQTLSRESGFPTYASVAAYERGVQATPRVVHPGDAGLDDADVEAPEAVAAPAAPTAAALAWAAAARPTAADRSRADRRRGLYIAAAALFVVGVLLLFLVAPTATVTIVLQATSVKEEGLTIQGTPDPNAASGPLKVLTVVSSADEMGQVDFKATGQKQIAAAAATSAVVFATDYVAPFCLRIVTGTVLAESGSLRWVSSGTPVYDAQCGGSGVYIPGGTGIPGPPSKPIPVTASSTGAAGNVAAGAINQPDPGINGCNPANYPPGGTVAPPPCSPKDFMVANPAPSGGGTDAKTLTVVSDGDVSAYTAALDAQTKQLTAKVEQDMMSKAPGRVFAVDPAKSGLTIASDLAPTPPKSGDQAPADQKITVTVHGTAAMYNPKEVRSRLEEKLRADVQQVQANAVLSDKAKVIGDPVVQQAGDDGVVVFSISGSGYAQPPVDTDKLRDGFSGKGKDAVAQGVRDQYGRAVQDVRISQSIPFPILPFFSSRIQVDLCVRSSDQRCSG